MQGEQRCQVVVIYFRYTGYISPLAFIIFADFRPPFKSFCFTAGNLHFFQGICALATFLTPPNNSAKFSTSPILNPLTELITSAVVLMQAAAITVPLPLHNT